MTSPSDKDPHTAVWVAEPVLAPLPSVTSATGRRGQGPAAGPDGREPVRVRRADCLLFLSPAGFYRIPLGDLGGTPLRPACRHPEDVRGLGPGDLGHGGRFHTGHWGSRGKNVFARGCASPPFLLLPIADSRESRSSPTAIRPGDVPRLPGCAGPRADGFLPPSINPMARRDRPTRIKRS